MINKKNVFLFLALILIIGAMLRLYNLGEEDLWLDEVISVSYSSNSVMDLASGNVQDRGNPPLFYIILNFWTDLLDNSAFAMRLLPALFSFLSLFFIFKIADRLFDYRAALLSTFIMAIGMIQIVYAQELRPYSILSFLALFSCYFFINIIKKNKVKDYLIFSFAIIIANYVHYLGIILFALYNIIFIMMKKGKKDILKKWFLYQGIIFLAILPILVPMIKAIWLLLDLIVQAFKKYILIDLIAIVILLILVFLLKKDNQKRIKKLVLNKHYFNQIFISFLALIGIIYLVTFRYLMGHDKMFLLRYSLFLFPVLYIILSLGILRLKPKKFVFAAILVIVLINSFALYTYYKEPTKEEWSKVAKLIEHNTSPEDALLFDAGYISIAFYYYHPEKLNSFNLISSKDQSVNYENFTATYKLLNDSKTIWLILSHNWRTKYYYRDLILEEYPYVMHKNYNFKDIEVIKFTKKEESQLSS